MDPISRIAVFQTLPPDALARLQRGAIAIEPRNGAEIFGQGDPSDCVYAVCGGEGSVRIGSIDRNTKRLMVEVFAAGDIFGEIGVIDPGPRTAAAVVDGRVKLLRISAAAFSETLRDTPQLGQNLAVMLARRLRRTFALLQDATFEKVDVRLARQLLYLARLQGRKTADGIVLGSRLRQPDLADLLGTTTRSIITTLGDWREAGVVQYDARRAQLTICDEARLQALVETKA
jgi:CRP-like cAMP-binding protein